MRKARVSITLSMALLLTGLSLNLCGAQASQTPDITGTQASQTPDVTGTYVITNRDSTTRKFVSRGLITFYADHNLAVVDSGQGGTPCSSTPSSSSQCPSGAFSNQLGIWGDSSGSLTGRTIDFDFPPPDDNLFRLDWTFTVGPAANSISGTVTLYSFPLTANPNDGGGTLFATFTFIGYKVTLP